MTDTANAPEHQARANTDPTSEVDELRAELHLLKTAGIIEVAARNPSVMEYMEHWEGCAIKAETHCDELVAAAYLDAARVPTSFLVGDPPNGIPFRSPMAHEVAEAIKARTPDNARATLTAYGERMKAEAAREAQAKIARLTEALAIAGPIALKVFDYHLFTLDAEDQRKVETIRAALQENANG